MLVSASKIDFFTLSLLILALSDTSRSLLTLICCIILCFVLNSMVVTWSLTVKLRASVYELLNCVFLGHLNQLSGYITVISALFHSTVYVTWHYQLPTTAEGWLSSSVKWFTAVAESTNV